MTSRRSNLAAATCLALLTACGGGGDSSGTPPPAGSSAQLAQQCAPGNTFAPAPRNGSLDIERRWVRAYIDEAYLWSDEVPNVNTSAAQFNDPYVPYSLYQYFMALLVTPKDRFSFMYPTVEWQQLAGAGVQAGYGIEWVTGSATPPRDIRIAYVQPGSPAATAGFQRGDRLHSIDNVSADVSDTDPTYDDLRGGLYPSTVGELHTVVVVRNGQTTTTTLSSANVTMTPVPLASVITGADGAQVGYLVFHDHVAPAEAQLIAAINTLRAANVTELVLDLRYNGGGYLYIASQLAYMIAGPSRTDGKVFERLNFSAKRAAETQSANSRYGFRNTSCNLDANYNCTSQAPLPTLNLARVHVITRAGTCSASEAIINGLRGADVDVRQIGSTTCGKPYGFTAQDNCGISYFPIEFQGVNDKGFGDYASGFTPAGSGATGVPGCVVADDFSKPLGDPTEGMLAAALAYRINGSCPAAPLGTGRAHALSAAAEGGFMQRGPVRENRLLVPQR